MQMTPYMSFIAVSRYARWLDDEQRRETWDETVDRYIDFMRGHLSANYGYDPADSIFTEVGDGIKGLDFVPSMRALMTAGPALERSGGLSAYNCSMVTVNDTRVFGEAIVILMNGVGLGFSVEEKHTSQLPAVPATLTDVAQPIVVEDSKEGWAVAYQALIDELFAGRVREFDVSAVRPLGARLKTFGGRASGPGPLLDLRAFTVDVFRKAAGRRLHPIECHDLMCMIGNVVVAGGTRRSALISLSDLSDFEMAKAKSGNWYEGFGHRALANNSVAYHEKPGVAQFLREWRNLVESQSGERGIFNIEGVRKHTDAMGLGRDASLIQGTNPCVTGDTTVNTIDGYKTVRELVGKKTMVVLDGRAYHTTIDGFFSTGVKPVYILRSKQGHSLRLTIDHKIMTRRGWVEAGDLVEGDDIRLSIEDGQDIRYTRFASLTADGEEEVFDVQVPGINAFDANGLYVHNCGEIALRDMGLCNLSEVVVRAEDTVEVVANKIRLATIVGTWQSSLTQFPYLRGEWRANAEEERLLGVSLTGIYGNTRFNNPNDEGLAKRLERLRDHAVKVNREEAAKMGINPSVAITTLKPSGTASQLLGVSSGIHPWHSETYIRSVRGANHDPLTRLMIDAGVPHEPDVMKPDENTVFYFPIAAPKGAVTRADITALDHLNLYAIYRKHWAHHQVSITVSVADDEWVDVGAWVYSHWDDVAGISFLPKFEDSTTYKQLPYQTCTREEYEAMVAASPESVRFADLVFYENTDGTTGTQTLACTASGCETVDLV